MKEKDRQIKKLETRALNVEKKCDELKGELKTKLEELYLVKSELDDAQGKFRN